LKIDNVDLDSTPTSIDTAGKKIVTTNGIVSITDLHTYIVRILDPSSTVASIQIHWWIHYEEIEINSPEKN
jgi:hypothetical protein